MTERFTGKVSDRNMVSNGIYGMIGKRGRYFVGEAIDKLAEYETAEEEGRLVVLPCKVGDIIFCIVRPGIIRQFKVLSIEIYEYGAILELLYAGNVEKYRFWRIYMPSDDFGKKLFLTSKEAEEALKEMKK